MKNQKKSIISNIIEKSNSEYQEEDKENENSINKVSENNVYNNQDILNDKFTKNELNNMDFQNQININNNVSEDKISNSHSQNSSDLNLENFSKNNNVLDKQNQIQKKDLEQIRDQMKEDISSINEDNRSQNSSTLSGEIYSKQTDIQGQDIDKIEQQEEINQNYKTNQQRLTEILENKEIRKTIVEKLQKQGKPIPQPVIRLQVLQNGIQDSNNPTELVLQEQDLKEVFKYYGKVQEIKIMPKSSAIIKYEDFFNALVVIKSLDKQQIPGLGVKMSLMWEEEFQKKSQQQQEQNSKQIQQQGSFNFQMSQEDIQIMGLQNRPKQNSCASINNQQSIKYTCRYDIQISNDKEFQVARKIIGSKGSNMKKIIEQSINGFNIPNKNEALKLRLRGKGSGFKEGPEKQESFEPLHLCISGKYPKMYQAACQAIENLLEEIYKEYKQFCQRKGRYCDNNLGIKKQESTNIEKSSNTQIQQQQSQNMNQMIGENDNGGFNMQNNMGFQQQQQQQQFGGNNFGINNNQFQMQQQQQFMNSQQNQFQKQMHNQQNQQQQQFQFQPLFLQKCMSNDMKIQENSDFSEQFQNLNLQSNFSQQNNNQQQQQFQQLQNQQMQQQQPQFNFMNVN